ncbi:mucoidy inhibitor MuiA family protein [Pseudoflavitalea rhizosphaerae]|uniref:mucoidy inhibitor MuiA family protein n=1 Tax=Pseudoflavitalea rhizosphaerae TaxID=1884793 RepID=UPI000F8CD1C4|nr:mucoidy inhibitor MuiA family protein [Pseudoflavitalea rhizosphaerae]
MKQLIVVAVFSLFHFSSVFAKPGPGKNAASSTLKSAIVYRTGAELFHTARITLAQGNNEFVIEGISNQIELNSVRVTSDNSGLAIMSVEFGKQFLEKENTSPEVKRLKDSAEKAELELAVVQSNITTIRELQAVLAANKSIAGSQTGVSVAELTKLMDYYRSKATELQKESLQLSDKATRLLKLISRLQDQVKEEEKKNTITSGQLAFQAFSPMAGTYTLNISYLTPYAGWNPAYDLRVESISKPVNIGFKAKVSQTTGLDWKGVKLVLATSMPNMNATAPELQSWLLSFRNLKDQLAGMVPGIQVRGIGSNADQYALSEVVVTGYGGARKEREREIPEPVYVVNGEIISKEKFSQINKNAIKSISILKADNAAAIYGSRAAGGATVVTLKDGLQDYVAENDGQLNVTYEIDLPYDVPTNGKEQVVSLKDRTTPAIYKYFAAPVKDKDAYLIGCIADWEGLQLLPGEANIIFEGTYVGKTRLNPGSTSDTLNLTLGKDRRVVITREKLKDFSSVKFLGSKKLQTFTYEITVKNNKKEAIQVQVKDLFPIPTDKEIEVELLEFSGAEVDKEKSFLTWNLDIKPGESRKLRMSFSVKYPKDKQLPL